MVEFIDRIWCWLILDCHSWRTTAFLMHWRHQWFTKYRRWCEGHEEWEKRV